MGLPKDGNDKEFVQALLRMSEVLLSGVAELNDEQLEEFVRHAKNPKHWARKTKRSVRPLPRTTVATTSDSTAVARVRKDGKKAFVIPVPGRNGALADVLKGKTVVLTGVFPEVGGGAGLSLGKAKVKAMVQSFGGRVTGSISGKTDMLVVGKNPGFSKVSNARHRGLRLITLHDLKQHVEGTLLENVDAPKIAEFSNGYGGNGLAKLASAQELAIAQGIAPAPLKLTAKPNAKSPKKPAAKSVRKKAQPKAAKPDEAASVVTVVASNTKASKTRRASTKPEKVSSALVVQKRKEPTRRSTRAKKPRVIESA